MATTIANPVIRLNFRGANFFKGLISAKSRFRSFWRDIRKNTQRGMKGSNSALIGGLTIARGVLIGFLSFALVSIFAKLFNTVKRVFTEIPKLVAKAGSEMETALVEVNKAVDLNAEQTETLRRELVNFSRVTPTTTKQLLTIAAAGARMGIALDEDGNVAKDATQRLIAFAKSIAKADVAIEDLSTEEIGRGVGKLLKLFGLGVEQTDNLTSALNSAAQTSAAFASEILNATTRSAGAARQFKFTVAEAIAVSTTFIELGRTAEITGSSFERLLNIIAKPENFEKFGKLLDITADQFGKLIDKSPLETIRAIFAELGKTRSVTEANKVLTNLFGTNVRLTGSVRGLAQGIKLLDKNLRIERQAFKEAISINKEFALVLETVTSRFKTLRGSFTAAFEDLFVKLQPSIKLAIDSLTEVSTAFTTLTRSEDFIAFIKNLIEDFANLAKQTGLFIAKLISVTVKADKLVGGQGFFAVLAEQVKSFSKSLTVDDITLFIRGLNVLKIILNGIIEGFKKITEAVLKTKTAFRRASGFVAEFFTISQEGKKAIRRQNREIDRRLKREARARREAEKKEAERIKKLFNALNLLTNKEQKKLNIKKQQTEEDKKQVALSREKTVEAGKQVDFSKSILETQRKNVDFEAQVKKDLEERRRNLRERKRLGPEISDEEAKKLIDKIQKENRERFKRRSRIILDPETLREFQEKQAEREARVTKFGPGFEIERFKRTRRAVEEGGMVRGKDPGRFDPATGLTVEELRKSRENIEATLTNTKLTAEEMALLTIALANLRLASGELKDNVGKANRALAGTKDRSAR